MIRLDRVTKHYPGVDAPAVAELCLDVAAGEIVVLLGPSGCGKTTTMRMINRLIEPTSGQIFIDGSDVTHVNPDQLRRHIGYVIQQVGLLPHLTIAANIGMVPRALGWNKTQIKERVTELLDLLGLDPKRYRGRYPKQLSGGEQQRVGVARALAADPPVMLMDEPFGALDPIIRDRLQDEFLALQEKIQKTIVFVTHDIEEALKLGDRIAIFEQGGIVAQYDTPIRLLTQPANEFVASFVGAGSSVRLLGLQHVGDLPLGTAVGGRGGATVTENQTLYDALDAMLAAHNDQVTVLGEDGAVRGTLAMSTVLQHIPDDGVGDSEGAR